MHAYTIRIVDAIHSAEGARVSESRNDPKAKYRMGIDGAVLLQ